MTLFCPRSPPFMSSNGIFLQAKWSKIKERVEGWKSGKKMWFKRITAWVTRYNLVWDIRLRFSFMKSYIKGILKSKF